MRHTFRFLPLALALAGCDDTTFPTPPGGELPTGAAGQGWCGVKATFDNECAACHAEGGGIGGLDLVTDPHAAIVGIESDRFPGKTIVVPNDPEGSLLYRKITGTQAADEGTPMPPGQTVDAAVAEVFRAWIADGADDVCDGGGGGTGGGQGVHPEGWALPTVHGLETKLGTGGDCRTCHGLSLQGAAEGAGISCDDCHQDEWEETCTFCHGGVDGLSGAPPEDIDDNADPSSISFPAHNMHVQRTIHAPWECSECHVKPESALDPGHFFDDATPGVAEVGFATATLSPAGVYDGVNGGCSNLYCHSSGQQGATGEVAASASTSCHLCHPDWTSAEPQLEAMSGEHKDHVGDSVTCSECHPTVDPTGQLTGAGVVVHVDGQRQTAFPADMTVTGAGVNRTCTGTCHEEDHEAEDW